jgi:hypothetical protein
MEKELFRKSMDTNIYVATIGINREDWYCHLPGMSRTEVRETMVLKGFDVVPIVDKSGAFRSYFTLSDQDSAKLKVKEIEPSDRLYYLTHVRDAIWRMKTERRTHYFLSNGRTENDIVGLLSLSNYNCREFYVFLFSLISYVEREFAGLITIDKDAAFDILNKLSHTKELRDQIGVIQQRIKEDKEADMENDYREYLYLHHLVWLVKSEKKYVNLGYKTSEAFETGTSGLKALRNNIAHPVKSLVRTLADLDKLDVGLNKLYEFKERLDEYLGKGSI